MFSVRTGIGLAWMTWQAPGSGQTVIFIMSDMFSVRTGIGLAWMTCQAPGSGQFVTCSPCTPLGAVTASPAPDRDTVPSGILPGQGSGRMMTVGRNSWFCVNSLMDLPHVQVMIYNQW